MNPGETFQIKFGFTCGGYKGDLALDDIDQGFTKDGMHLPLRFRKAGRGWCGDARETH